MLTSNKNMAKKFICGGEKYEVGGLKEDTIGLPVSFSELPVKIQVEGCELFLKDSFHISLVCIGKIIEKNQLTIPDFVNKVIADFCDFTNKINIELDQYRDEFRFVSENDRKSVVAMCDIKNLDKFFDFLNQKYNLNLEYPPTHATLYTLQPNLGIFLTDTDDIKRLTKRIEAPIKLK
jgi:hypothetical protein